MHVLHNHNYMYMYMYTQTVVHCSQPNLSQGNPVPHDPDILHVLHDQIQSLQLVVGARDYCT